MVNVGVVGYGVIGKLLGNLCSNSGPNNIHVVDPALGYNDNLSHCAVVFMCTNVHADASYEAYSSLLNGYKLKAPHALFVMVSTINYNWVDKLSIDVVMPEFIREHHVDEDYRNQQHVILGTNKYSSAMTVWNLINNTTKPQKELVITSKIKAMQCKLFLNAYLSMKVNFANIAHSLGGDELLGLVRMDKRLGSSHLDVPGPDGLKGFGGTCLPKDLEILRDSSHSMNVKELLNSILLCNQEYRKP